MHKWEYHEGNKGAKDHLHTVSSVLDVFGLVPEVNSLDLGLDVHFIFFLHILLLKVPFVVRRYLMLSGDPCSIGAWKYAVRNELVASKWKPHHLPKSISFYGSTWVWAFHKSRGAQPSLQLRLWQWHSSIKASSRDQRSEKKSGKRYQIINAGVIMPCFVQKNMGNI